MNNFIFLLFTEMKDSFFLYVSQFSYDSPGHMMIDLSVHALVTIAMYCKNNFFCLATIQLYIIFEIYKNILIDG